MLYFVAFSILIRLTALCWSVVMWVRLRDSRIGWITALLVYMTGRQIFTFIEFRSRGGLTNDETVAEALAMGTSLVCLGILWGLGRMVQDRDKAAESLRRSEATQRALLDAIPDAMFRMSHDGTYLGYQIRDSARLIVPPSQFMGRKASEVLPEPMASLCMRAVAAAASTGKVQTYEYEFTRGEETRFWEGRVSPCGADEVLVLVRDVSDRERVERVLQQTTDDLERAQAIAHAGTWISDSDTVGRLTWSDETCRIFGIERERFDERVETFFKHVHPDDVAAVREAARAAVHDNAPYDIEHRILRADGQTRWVHQQAAVVRDPQGSSLRMIGVVHDITARKLAELSLAQSERRYRLLFDLSPQPMFVFEQDTLRFLAVNQAAIREYGYSEAEFLAMSYRDIVAPEDLPELERRLASAGPEDRSQATGRHRRRDGSVLDVQVNDSPLEFRDRRARMVIASDLTEQRRAQEALRESEERYRRLAEHGAVGIWEIGTDGRTIYVNPMMCRILEVESSQSLRGMDFRQFFTPESLALVEREWARRRKGEPSTYQVDLIGARGGRRIAIISGAPMLDARSVLTSFVGTITDVTELKLAEERLRTAEQRYTALIRQTPLGVIMWDVNKRVLEWNPTAEAIFGYTFEQAAGKTYEELIVPESTRPQVERVWAALLAHTGGVRSTNENVTRAGRRIVCEWYNTPLVGADGKVMGVASLIQEVTEIRRREAELRQSQKMEAIGRLASGVAHDFSNLLTAISGFTSLARRTLSPEHPAVRSLDRVDEAARQAVGVTKSLLTFSRGGGGAPKGPVHLGNAVEDAVRILRRTIPASINLRVRVAPGDLYIHGDTTQLQQVVMNLAINARDAMPRGGTLSIAVAGRESTAGPQAALVVSDTGVGMSAEVQAHIFEPFFTTKPVGEGTGLGLAITHAIVKDHAGRIEIESAPGKGSTFTILLPASTPPDPDEQPSDGVSAPVLIGRGQPVLLTSGRTYLRELMASALSSLGFSMIQASDLEAAGLAAAQSGAKVHIVDVENLGIQDNDVINHIGRSLGTLTTIYLVAEAKASDWKAKAGSITVPKPFQISELAAAVSEALQ